MATKEILLLLLWWLLGILWPWIVMHISSHYKRDWLLRIIKVELLDIKSRLAYIPFIVYPKYGILDKDTLLWIKNQTDWFKFKRDSILDDEIRENMLKNMDDSDFLEDFLSTLNHSTSRNGGWVWFKKITLNIISSHMMDTSVLDIEFLEKILSIKYRIDALNQEFDRVDEYIKLTFDWNISIDNHEIISSEIKRTNLFIAEMSIWIAEEIRLALKK